MGDDPTIDEVLLAMIELAEAGDHEAAALAAEQFFAEEEDGRVDGE